MMFNLTIDSIRIYRICFLSFLTSFWNLQLRHKRTVVWVELTLESIQWDQALDSRVFTSKCVWWDLIRSKHVTLFWLLSTPGDTYITYINNIHHPIIPVGWGSCAHNIIECIFSMQDLIFLEPAHEVKFSCFFKCFHLFTRERFYVLCYSSGEPNDPDRDHHSRRNFHISPLVYLLFFS